ncbi:MAG: hypothetical protein C0491_09510 [Novosphingobium sp.]|nr:hypothetical protein [Novosphingobium sp.]
MNISAFKKFLRTIAVGASIFAAATTPAAAESWYRLNSRHFALHSAGSVELATKLSNDLERFDFLVRQMFGIPDDPNAMPLPIYLLPNKAAVGAMYKVPEVAGFFSHDIEGRFIVSHREVAMSELELGAQTTLFHEYAHFLMFRNFRFAYPSWYVEGFAEYLSTVEFDSQGRFDLGRPARHRAWSLARDDMPLTDVLAGKQGHNSDLFYGKSWLLVHFLSTSQERKGQLGNYLSLVAGGMPPDQAGTAAFGDLKKLDRELDKYMRGSIKFSRSATPLPQPAAPALERLSPVDSAIVPLHIMRFIDKREEEALGELRQIAMANPQSANAAYEVARAAQALANNTDDTAKEIALWNEAEKFNELALKLQPGMTRANLLKGEIEMHRLENVSIRAPERWTAARSWIRKASDASPYDSFAFWTLFQSYSAETAQIPGQARYALRRALELAPEASSIRAAFAWDQANQGRFDDAIAHARILANDPHGGPYGKSLLTRIERWKSTGQVEKPCSADHEACAED